jgi:hypothetical protein
MRKERDVTLPDFSAAGLVSLLFVLVADTVPGHTEGPAQTF